MKVTITHSTKTEGLIKKTTSFVVAVKAQFSQEESAVIGQYQLAEAEVLNPRPNHPHANWYALTISGLWNGHSHTCSTPLEAKIYDTELREALPKVKTFIDAHMEPLSGSDTFEL